MTEVNHEAFFGLVERPFSLTPDPKYFFRARSHGRALESLIFGVRRRDPYLLVTGDRGVGKTTICRTLADQLRRRMPVAYVARTLLSPTDLLRLVLEDFSGASTHPLTSLPATSESVSCMTYSCSLSAA